MQIKCILFLFFAFFIFISSNAYSNNIYHDQFNALHASSEEEKLNFECNKGNMHACKKFQELQDIKKFLKLMHNLLTILFFN